MKNRFLDSALAICLLAALALGRPSSGADASGLIGHWKLAGDAQDSSGGGNDGENHAVDLNAAGPRRVSATSARFNGKDAFIQVPSSEALRLGERDFTFAAWVHTADQLDDAIGDIVSKFDPVARRGFSLCIRNAPGTSGSQSNYRNVQFGIDAGTEPKWTDCGRPGNAVYVMALAVHDGHLFAGTCEPGEGETGHVYRYAGDDRWDDCGSLDRSNAVTCLASNNGKLFAGTGAYRTSGSAMPDSPNKNPGGRVFRWDGENRWTDCGQLSNTVAVGGLLNFRGQLYATSLYQPPGMFRFDGNANWLPCPLPRDGKRVVAPAVFNGQIYATSFDGCAIYRFDGEQWSEAVQFEPSGQTYSLDVHAGELYVGTWPNGHVYRSADGEKWIDAGRLGQENEVMGMAVFNGKLYGGTLPSAQVHRYDGDANWTNTGQLDRTPDVRYRRAWSMAVYQGRLFCGTLPSGHVHALSAGANVTCDRELAPGWRHIAGVRELDRLHLYIDGKLVATTSQRGVSKFDLSNDAPLKIGLGGHDYFNGSLSDVRLYGRALGAEEIGSLMAESRR